MATYLVGIVLGVLVIRGVIYLVQFLKKTDRISLNFDNTMWLRYLICFF